MDVGAGAGSIVRWLSNRVGPTGHVVAADMDTRFLTDLTGDNVEVRRLDITQDELEADTYDLIHARAMLMHLDDPAEVVRRMARALAPGGWLLVEDPISGAVPRLTARIHSQPDLRSYSEPDPSAPRRRNHRSAPRWITADTISRRWSR